MKKSLILLCLIMLPSLRGSEMPSGYADKLADAIRQAENSKRYPYGIIVRGRLLDEPTARRWCIGTVKANWTRWQAAGAQGDYLEFLARRYAPVGASNDPTGLNCHWLRNVRFFLAKSTTTKGIK